MSTLLAQRLLLALAIAPLSARSAPPSDAILFPPVVVEAAGYGADPFRTPFATSVLTRDILERHPPRTLPSALEELPGVMVQKTSAAQGSPYLRGFTGFRTLLLVDGIRLNNATFREGPNQYWGTVDPLSLDRIEVVQGPGSVAFGGDAIGGVVNAVTATPDLSAPGPASSARLFYRHATADSSHMGRLEVSGRIGDRAAAHLGFSRKTYGDLRAGGGTGLQPRTGYDESGLDGSLALRLGPRAQLTALWQGFAQDDAWRTHTTVFGGTWLGTRPGGDLQRSLDQGRRLLALQARARDLDGPIHQLHAGLSRHTQRENQFRLRSDRRREISGFAADTLGAFAQAQSRSSLGHWVYGADVYRDRVDSHSVRHRADGSLAQVDIQGPVADDATYDLAGAFLENRLPRLGPVDLVLGARYNLSRADARRVRDPLSGATRPLSDRWRSLVGSLRGVLPLDTAGRHNLFAGLSEAFRAPNLSDLTRFDIAEGGQIETPAPGLVPERFLTAELGWRARHPAWSASLSAFHTAIRNQIIRTPTGARVDGLDEVTKRNSGSGFVRGLELAGSVRLPRDCALAGTLSWMRGDLDHFPTASATRPVRAPLSRVMPLTGHLSLRWEPRAARHWLELAATAAARQDRLAPNDLVDTERIPRTGTPGYATARLQAGWRPTPALALTLALENIADKDHRIHGSGLNEPGRQLILTADHRF